MKKSLSLIMALMLVVLSLFTFNIKSNIKAQELTDDQIIDIELNNIYVPSETIFSFPLVTDSAYNSDITWTSNNEEVITIKNGWAVVNRPTDSDKEVTLTVTIKRESLSKEKEFKVTVLKGETETNSYKINYTLNGGENNPNNPATYKVGETPKLLNPTNGTVEFLGWYLNGELITELPLGLSGDINVVAKWGAATLTSIEVLEKPIKLEYNAFDKFDAAGLVIRAYYNDSEHSYIDIDSTNQDLQYDKAILHGNDTKVIITYHGLQTEVEIKVNKINYDLSNIKFDKVETTYDGLEHVALISGTLPEGVKVNYSNNKLTNVGELTAVASFEYDEENYNKPADLTTTIKINKAQLQAKVQDVQIKPGDTPVYTVVFSGFVNGENEEVLDDEIVFIDNLNNDYSKPGTYQVGLKEMFDNNYEIIRFGGTLTITEGEYVLDVLEETLVKTYNGQNQMFDVLVKQGDQTITTKELEFKLVDGTEFTGATNVGKYEVIVSLKDGEAESLTVTFEITKATYDLSKVEFEDITVTFDGNTHELVYNNIPEGLKVVVEGETKLTNVGYVEATISFVNENNNYNDVTTTISAILTINKANLSDVEFSELPDVSFTGEAHEPKVNGKLGEYVLTENDYTITYDRNTDIGTAYVILNGKGNFEGEVQLTFEITESDLAKVRKAKEELEKQITELPETFVLETTNKSQVTWLSTSTALMINEDGTYKAILVENANEVVVYALVQYNNAVDYARFTFTLPVKDTDTNIEIENVESNITIKAEQLNDTTLANYTVEGENVVFGYDISLIKENASVQPNNKVTVRIPIPTEYLENTTLKVYHVTQNGNVDMNAIPENGYLVFETESFSHYFVTIEKVEEEDLEVTVEEMLELEVSDTFYQVTGVIRNIYNTTYGNFYLYNLEESVYITVYGLTAEQVSSNDKSFATLGLKEGDIVTLIGTRADFNGTAQIGGPAYYVSHTSPEYEVSLEVEGEGQAELSANKVENGKTVTLTVSANEGYKLSSIKANDKNITLVSDQEEYEITVNAKTTIKVTFVEDSGEEEEEQGFVLLTDITKLQVGDRIIIAAMGFDFAISTTQNTNNRAQAAIIRSGNTITYGDDVLVITVEAGTKAGTFAFNTDSGYLYAASSGSNHLKTKASLDDNGSWSITVSADGIATIKAQGSNTRNWMRYNSTNNPPLFSCYGSGQADICIYRESAGGTTTPVEKTDAEKVALDKEALSLPQTTTQDLDLPSLGANGSTITWTSNNEAITDEGVVTRGTSDVKVTLTATLKLNNETETVTFEVTVLAKAEMSETGTFTLTSPAASANMSGSNQIASLNSEVDETKWSAIGNKKSASNNIGLYAEIRLYGKDGDGNELTISSSEYTIQTIKITFKSGYSAGAVVYVNGLKVEAVDGVYTINANEFIIKNENSGTTQVRITEIEITYSGGSSTN